jgi:hypothetical protein
VRVDVAGTRAREPLTGTGFSARRGRTATVHTRLTAAARPLLAERGTIRARVTAELFQPDGSTERAVIRTTLVRARR